MFFYALAFLLGIVCVQQLSVLAETSYLLYTSVAAIGLGGQLFKMNLSSRRSAFNEQLTLTLSFILLFSIGFVYASLCAKQQLSHRLDDSLAGQDILLQGRVTTIPVINTMVRRFEFEVDSFELSAKPDGVNAELNHKSNSRAKLTLPDKVRLSWYYGSEIRAGEQWQLLVRLKPPHGFMNPGGFDYEAWLFQQHLDATGYVRESALNKLVSTPSRWSIDAIRQNLTASIDRLVNAKQINEQGHDLAELDRSRPDAMTMIKALTNGDKSSISSQQWEVLKNTGTSHLMAISGLHIGLAALFIYVLIRRILPEYVMKRVPAQHVAIIAGMGMALLYALVAGWSIPTQRAVIMLCVLSLMLLLRRNHRPFDALGLALMVVLVFDPLAVLSAGFWFSFSAVAVIFISVAKAERPDKPVAGGTSRWSKLLLLLKQWLRLQFLISLFLLPLSLFMFQQVSLVSPLANLLLIPYVSFLVVPLVLLAIICSFVSQTISVLLFTLAAQVLDFIWPVLTALSRLPHAFWVKGDVDIILLLSATTALLLMYYSRRIKPDRWRWGLRLTGMLMLLPLFLSSRPALQPGEFQITVLDVGQGSAAVIQTKNYTAVFDTGAKFSAAMDAGASAVVPYLRYLGVESLDMLMVSHGDNDHIGGAQSIIDAYPAVTIIGQDIQKLISNNKQACASGFKWQRDGVDFAFLSPPPFANGAERNEKRNNHSCVLRLASAYGSALFTGDIESKVEQRLLEAPEQLLSADILLVPHHGSNTSSSQAFIAELNAKYSIISVGYKNRYRLPSSKVISRYAALQRPLLRTDESGAITLKIDRTANITLERYREKSLKYWHHVLK